MREVESRKKIEIEPVFFTQMRLTGRVTTGLMGLNAAADAMRRVKIVRNNMFEGWSVLQNDESFKRIWK